MQQQTTDKHKYCAMSIMFKNDTLHIVKWPDNMQNFDRKSTPEMGRPQNMLHVKKITMNIKTSLNWKVEHMQANTLLSMWANVDRNNNKSDKYRHTCTYIHIHVNISLDFSNHTNFKTNWINVTLTGTEGYRIQRLQATVSVTWDFALRIIGEQNFWQAGKS